MESPLVWWYLPGKMGIFMGYVSFRKGKGLLTHHHLGGGFKDVFYFIKFVQMGCLTPASSCRIANFFGCFKMFKWVQKPNPHMNETPFNFKNTWTFGSYIMIWWLDSLLPITDVQCCLCRTRSLDTPHCPQPCCLCRFHVFVVQGKQCVIIHYLFGIGIFVKRLSDA